MTDHRMNSAAPEVSWTRSLTLLGPSGCRETTTLRLDRRAGTTRCQLLTSAGRRGKAPSDKIGATQLKAPTPIPEHEARWAWDWMASWGLMEGPFDDTAQVNRKVEREAHELAAAALAV